MFRTLVSVLFSLLLAFSSASAPETRSSLKRKHIEIKSESISDASQSGCTSVSSSLSSSSNPSPVIRSAVPAPPSNPWIIANRFDLDPVGLPQSKKHLVANRALFMALGRGDFETTCLLLSLFDDLKLSRYFQELLKNSYLTFYHLAIMKFSVEEFKTIISFCNELDILYPSSGGRSVFDMAIATKDQTKIDFLRPIFLKYQNKVLELKQQVNTKGIVSLFIKEEL